MTRNGIATKVAATTAPEVWKGSVIPKVFSSQGPSSPRRPKPRSSATPPTVGGSTIGSRTRERTNALPGKSVRASSQASGTPSSRERPSAQKETSRESLSAWVTPGLVRWVPRSAQDVRARIPINGISRNATASSAGIARATGVRTPGTRLRRALIGGSRNRSVRAGSLTLPRSAGRPDCGRPDRTSRDRTPGTALRAAGSPPTAGSSAPEGCSAISRTPWRPRCSWTVAA